MPKNYLKQNNNFGQLVERLNRQGLIKKEHGNKNISLNTSQDIVQLSNTFITKKIKISLPTQASTSTSTTTKTKNLKFNIRKCEMPKPTTDISTLSMLNSSDIQPIGPPILYPNCSKCGAKLDNLYEFQKRIAGFESNFFIDFVCIRCIKRRQAVILDKKKFEDFSLENPQKNALKNKVNHIEDTLWIKNVESEDDGSNKQIFKKSNDKILESYETEYLDVENDDYSIDLNTSFSQLCSTLKILSESSPVNVIKNVSINVDKPQLSRTPIVVPSAPDLIHNENFNNTDNFEDSLHSLSPIQFDENPELEENYTENPDDSLKEQIQYHCVECNRSYSSLQNLKYHGYHVHNPDRPRKFREYPDLPYKCDVCRRCYISLSKLKSHIYYMHVDCPSSLARRDKTRKFKFIKRKVTKFGNDDNTKKTTLTCKTCARDFTNKTALDRHILRWHPILKNRDPSTIFNCNECKTTYGSYKRLLSHIYYYHPGKYSKKKQVRKCYSTKSKHYNIVRHGTKVMLLLIKPLFCDSKANTKEIVGKDDTFIVESKDDKKNRYNCQICWRRYKTPILLKTHLTFYDHDKNKVKDSFKCKRCNKEYKTWKNLQCHFYYMHPNEKPKKTILSDSGDSCSDDEISYKCTHCNLKYKLYKHLRAHYYYKHPGIKPEQSEVEENPSPKYTDKFGNNNRSDNQENRCNFVIIYFIIIFN